MLSGLSNLLFGNGATDDAAVDQTQASPQVELDTQEEEMGWLLVDVPGKGSDAEGGKGNRGRLDGDAHEDNNSVSGRPPCLRSHVRNNVCPSQAGRCVVNSEGEGQSDSDRENHDVSMDVEMYDLARGPRLYHQLGESWIVTPPPCFTGTGGLLQLQSSPLENLLIEHPSMSVYHHSRRLLQDMEEEEEESDQVNQPGQGEEAGPRPLDPAINNDNAVQQRAPRPPRAVRACAGAVEQMRVTRSQQRRQQASAGKQLSRKCLERSNKTQMAVGSRRHLSARNRAAQPSGRMNGRRSQRLH